MQDLLNKLRSGDVRTVARMISLTENRSAEAASFMPAVFKMGGGASVVGVTGSPGAGKSSLVEELALSLSRTGRKVGIIAVDPSSPFSGGAVLGDRIRMQRASEEKGVFIRSLATRGALGGISHATLDAVRILDAAGFNSIIVETVGVGQAEVDIVRLADTCLVVLVPGMGDSIQSMKAGILEIADLFAINKSDRDGADSVERDLNLMLSLNEFSRDGWTPSIFRTVATKAHGIEALRAGIEKHQEWLSASPQGREKRARVLRENILRLLSDQVLAVASRGQETELDQMVEECLERREDPYSAARKLMQNQ